MGCGAAKANGVIHVYDGYCQVPERIKVNAIRPSRATNDNIIKTDHCGGFGCFIRPTQFEKIKNLEPKVDFLKGYSRNNSNSKTINKNDFVAFFDYLKRNDIGIKVYYRDSRSAISQEKITELAVVNELNMRLGKKLEEFTTYKLYNNCAWFKLAFNNTCIMFEQASEAVKACKMTFTKNIVDFLLQENCTASIDKHFRDSESFKKDNSNKIDTYLNKRGIIGNVGFVNEVMKMYDEISYILKELNTNGIIHNDIKPENIVKCGDKYKLIDFGLASYDVDSFCNRDGGTCKYIPYVKLDKMFCCNDTMKRIQTFMNFAELTRTYKRYFDYVDKYALAITVINLIIIDPVVIENIKKLVKVSPMITQNTDSCQDVHNVVTSIKNKINNIANKFLTGTNTGRTILPPIGFDFDKLMKMLTEIHTIIFNTSCKFE